MPRTVFLDFEASSLGKRSWPVEVAWVFEGGEAESHLIRPAPAWTDWADSAQAIHGIGRDRLLAEGTPHDLVARRMVEQLSGHALYATAPSWDGKWLSVLLRGAGLPRHTLRLEDTTLAHRRVVLDVLAGAGVPEVERAAIQRAVLADLARQSALDRTPDHRALADAQYELGLWRACRRLAQEAAAAARGRAERS